MSADANETMIAFLRAQILFLQGQLAELTGEEPEAEEQPKRRGPGRPKKSAAPAVKKPAPEPEDEEDDEDDEESDPRRVELEAMKITQLRALALKRGFKKDGVDNADKAELAEAIWRDEKDSSEESSEDEDAEDVEYSREDLMGMGIRKAKALAYERGATVADLKGFTLEQVVDHILGETDEDDDEDEDGEEEDAYTREDFEKMSLAELKAIGRQYELDYPGWKMPKGQIAKPALIEALLDEE